MASQTCTVLSLPPEAIRLLSGDQATVFMLKEGLRLIKPNLPLVASQICIVLSLLVEAIRLPSGDQAIDVIFWEWPG